MIFYQKTKLILSVCIYFSFVNMTHAVSFDCNKAKTFVEENICSDPELSKLDDDLANIYSANLKKSVYPKILKKQQLKWLSIRNKCHTRPCLKSAYQQQTEVLKTKNRGHEVEINPVGKYERKDTASIDITTLPNGNFHVSGDAVLAINIEMGDVRIGTLEGEFPLEGKVLYYSKLDDDCKLKITFLNSGLKVSEDNNQCGGLGVSFDGEYTRVTKK
jgi:uncharacterized protein